ncbi:MAG: hypothetical protein ABIF19_06830, partial [Planctomycetota bacterium]
MKSENRLYSSPIWHVLGPGRTGSYLKGNRTPERCGSNHLCILVISLLMLIGLAHTVYGRVELGEAGLSSEFCSTDVPKAIPDKGTTTSELVVDDTGPILDLDVRVKITHPWDSNMDVFLI